MRKIILTGGGTAGHVTPHFALIPQLQKLGWKIYYIGTHDGIERELMQSKLPYYPISAGKLRRYFDLKNFSDPFRVLKGVFEAYQVLREIKSDLVFSKGGFVSVPVTIAAWILRIPVILHESDLTPGLANKLSLPFANEICLTFPDSVQYLKGKGIVTGTPIRSELFAGSRAEGLKLCNFNESYPVLLVMGGSLGATVLNEIIWDNLALLLKNYQIIHLCGKGNSDAKIRESGYCQIEYAENELPHLFAAADFVISRAGANSIFELVALAKPHILVPLSKHASRGDQILNAESFAEQGFSLVIPEEELNLENLQSNLVKLELNKKEFQSTMQKSKIRDGTKNIMEIIEQTIQKKEPRRG